MDSARSLSLGREFTAPLIAATDALLWAWSCFAFSSWPFTKGVRRLANTRAAKGWLPARREALRGTFDPGYLNYTLGKLMILKLRDDYRREQGSAYSLREFHDRLLSYGGPALPLVRAAMLTNPGDSPI